MLILQKEKMSTSQFLKIRSIIREVYTSKTQDININ
jgi:hypothetical protein